MYKLVEWNENLDLKDFYLKAKIRGFENNCSQKVMIDCFRNEREWNAWILYQNDEAVGSVAAHSFDEFIPGSYRVLSRVCAFEYSTRNKGLNKVKRLFAEHQSISDQFFLPQCIKWVNDRGRIFSSSNQNEKGSQRLVHRHYFPTLESLGIVRNMGNFYYRGVDQTIWEIFPDKFLDNLKRFKSWHDETDI